MRSMNTKSLRRIRNRRGFTLTEIMLVLVIISVLAGAVAYSTMGVLGNANTKTAKTQVTSMSNMVNNYLLMVGSLPTELKDLHEQPANIANPQSWSQVSAKPIPKDPWGNDYVYTVNGQTFEIKSNGPDGQANTADDISSAN